MASGHAKVIESRKKADAQYKIMEAVRQQDQRILQIAQFENKTQNKIERKAIEEELEKRKQALEYTLYDRKCALADLYNREIAQWRQEVMERVETQEERKARIMERAYALRDARESARQKIVQEKYDQQWRDACDDARTLDSKALSQFMNDERKRQIEEKRLHKIKTSQNEDDFLAEWNRQLDEVARRDKEKQDNRKRVAMETSNDIKRQMEYNFRKREEYWERTKQEEQEELSRLRAEIEADQEAERKAHQDGRLRGVQVREFNAHNQAIKDSESGIEKEQDRILLEYALRKEAEKEAEEEAKRQQNKDAAKQYQKYLQDLMIKEAEDNSFVDAINKAEEEKVWKARDDALQARQDARDNLMRMVDEGRQEQIRQKHARDKMEKEGEQVYVKRFLNEAAAAVAKERAEAEERRKRAMENNERLLDQINYRKYREELAKQEIYLENKTMKYVEREHMKKLALQGGAVRTHRPKIHTDLSY